KLRFHDDASNRSSLQIIEGGDNIVISDQQQVRVEAGKTEADGRIFANPDRPALQLFEGGYFGPLYDYQDRTRSKHRLGYSVALFQKGIDRQRQEDSVILPIVQHAEQIARAEGHNVSFELLILHDLCNQFIDKTSQVILFAAKLDRIPADCSGNVINLF